MTLSQMMSMFRPFGSWRPAAQPTALTAPDRLDHHLSAYIGREVDRKLAGHWREVGRELTETGGELAEGWAYLGRCRLGSRPVGLVISDRSLR